ncbi:hypothetical protein MUN88_17125 [Gracilibacillus caseinilyticus]|uniref:Uncharacterized protein n=1 Tax=Gracilibacillus caseinilyticus TaxID=2932256 RepID=A0ABY4ETK4_9BACI|nr:hypothetical protein [Gracilibacillus caseinilyticus]UOQ47755.1 hypothetical protein MUN88_17125 [Gracilibacillus caseinilyticus]
MYSIYKLKDPDNNEEFIVYGNSDKVQSYLKERPYYKQVYGSGITKDSFNEIESIVVGLSKNHPGIEIIELGE